MSSFLTPRNHHTTGLAKIKEEINLQSYKPIISNSPRQTNSRKMLASTLNSKPMLSKIGKHSSFPAIKLSQVETRIPDALPKIIDAQKTSHSYDLYNPDPTISYLKEKYKMYLEWLSQNSNEENQEKQLNWYNYEKTVYAHDNNSLRFLKNSKLTNSSIENSIKEVLKSSHHSTGKKPNYSSMETYTSDLKIDEKVKEQARRRLSDIQTTKGHFVKVPNAFEQIAQTSNRRHTLIKSTSVNAYSKGVQFEAKNNNKLPSVYNTKQRRTMKPILKLQFSEFSSYNDESVIQIAEDSGKNLKLPPIVGCSEDFYAVLKDLELENKTIF